MRVVVFGNGEPFVRGVAGEIAAVLRSPDRERTDLGLTGGSTPGPVYAALRDEGVDWERIDLWLSDERWVPPDHDDSNGRMAAETLADHVPAAFHRPRWSPELDPEDSAAFYEATLRDLLPNGRSALVLLGMGDDGHTASLFPEVPWPEPDWRWFAATFVPKLDAWRLTSTPKLLREAERVMLLVSGAAKARVVAEAIEGPEDRYPVQLVRGARGEVTWLLDEDAASDLRTTPLDRRAP